MSIVVLCIIGLFISLLADKNNVFINNKKQENSISFIDEFSVELEENIIVNGSVHEKTIVVDDYGDEITNSSSRATYSVREKKVRIVNSRVIFKFEYKNIKYQFQKDFLGDEINLRMWFYQQEELKIYVAEYSSVVYVLENVKSPEYAFMFDYNGLIILNG